MSMPILLVSLALVASTATAQPPPMIVSVYVFTALAHEGDPTYIEAQRLDAVALIEKALPNNKIIAAQVAVAESRETATVALELVSAGGKDTFSEAGSRIEVYVHPLYTLKATLTFGSYSTDFNVAIPGESYKKIVNSGRFNTPDSFGENIMELAQLRAVDKLIKDVREWIALNRDDLAKQ